MSFFENMLDDSYEKVDLARIRSNARGRQWHKDNYLKSRVEGACWREKKLIEDSDYYKRARKRYARRAENKEYKKEIEKKELNLLVNLVDYIKNHFEEDSLTLAQNLYKTWKLTRRHTEGLKMKEIIPIFRPTFRTKLEKEEDGYEVYETKVEFDGELVDYSDTEKGKIILRFRRKK